MRIRLLLPVLSFLLLALWGCRERALESYYFPLDEFQDGTIYEFRGAKDERDPPFYWHYRTVEEDGTTFLKGMYYDHNLLLYQSMKEEKVANGMLLVDHFLYEYDSTGVLVQVPAEIEGGNVFVFGAPDPGQVLFSKTRFSYPSDPNTINTLIRNRQFQKDTTYTYGGKKYDAVIFYVRELIDIQDEGHTEHEFDGVEIYAKGLGLVYFRKNIGEGFITEYKLENRYSEEAFEERMGVRLR